MRILTLSFQNLNSLQGQWSIDFRHPAYADEGIFAITGATGAGKSTILDAICLALYGATPRLGDITQTTNDLMSRHTGECYAEVVFSTKSDIYRCHWGQKRAHKKPDGKLQSPKHEISAYIDGLNDKPLEEKASRTKALVETITGMDFNRFTRAMLLAQGSFSAFLQASSDERSPILEQITGTAIYSDISKKVHEFKRNAENALNTLTAQASGATLLTPAEEAELQSKKQLLSQTLLAYQTHLNELEQAKQWAQQHDEAQSSLDVLRQEADEIAQQTQAFAPHRTRLQRALKALSITADYQQLNYLREQRKANQITIEQMLTEQPMLEQAYQTATKQEQDSKQAYQASEQDWQAKQVIFKQVRQLDTTFVQKNQLYADSQQQFELLDKRQRENQQAIEQHQRLQVQYEQQIQKIETSQQQTPAELELPQTLATLQPLKDTLSQLIEQQAQIVQRQQLNQADYHKAQQQQSVSHAQLDALTEQIKRHQQQQLALDNQTLALSQGHSVSTLQQQVQSLWQLQSQLTTMQDWGQQLQHNQDHIQKHQQQLQLLKQTLSDTQARHEHTIDLQQQLSDNVALLDQQRILLSKITSLEAERRQLQAGDPCPLCGATDHPFAEHAPVLPDQNLADLNDARQRLDALNHTHQTLLLEINSLTKDIVLSQNQCQQLSDNNQQLLSKLTHIVQDNAMPSDILSSVNSLANAFQTFIDPRERLQQLTYFNNQLTSHHQSTSQQLTLMTTRLAQLDDLQAKQQELQQQTLQLSEQHNALLHEQTLYHNKLTQYEQQEHEYQAQSLDNQTRQARLQQQLGSLLSPFDTPDSPLPYNTLDQLTQSIHTLQQRWQAYQQLESRLAELREAIITTNQILTGLKSGQQQLLAQQQQLQQHLTMLQQDLTALASQRITLFGDLEVEHEERQLLANKQQTFDAWQTRQQTLNTLIQQKQTFITTLNNLHMVSQQLDAAIEQNTDQLHQRFSQLGFNDEDDYQQACLIDTEREQLQQQAESLTQRQSLNQSKQHAADHLIHELNEQLHQSPTLQAILNNYPTVAQLVEQIHQQQQELNEQQRALGAIEQQLHTNNELQQRQQVLITQIHHQREQYAQWQHLHELIGSSDGKKFRNFAQGLTFNIMIAHANEQLKKMSDRYLLLADPDQPLMLNVMDNYQGGQIRTSKNLSGGESFIISLSLALGLSNMASHRMQVDSLFLDEGFGTLDEEALDVALDTLTNLQQSGKLIGVISHIQALKDRISSQIQVIPQTGGISKIVGAGIKKLS